MYTKQTVLVNPSGMHARPASDFVASAKTFASKVFVRNLDVTGAEPVNAKSILSILTLGMAKGTHVEVSAEGCDEQAAVEKLIALIESGFGE